MNKNNLKIGTRVTFFPVFGAPYQAEGVIISLHHLAGDRRYVVKVSTGIGSNDNKGKEWFCAPDDITTVSPVSRA